MNKESLLHITTNSSCNLNCVYCCEGVRKNGRLIDEAFMGKDTDTRDRNIKVYVDLLKGRANFSGIVFSSGEPTLNPNLRKYIAFATRLGYQKIELVTNGVRVSDMSYLQTLVGRGLSSLVVSVNCFDEKMSRIVSGNNYNGKKTLIGIYNAIKLALPLQINIVINKHNLISLKKTLVTLRQIGAQSVILSFIRYDGFDDKIYTGLERIEKNSVTYTEFVDYFIRHDIGTTLKGFKKYNFNDFPLCVLHACSMGADRFKKSKDFNFFDRITGDFKELSDVGIKRIFLSSCSDCMYKKSCCGIEKDYLNIFGKTKIEKEIYPLN